MAMTAWLANVSRSAICLAEKGLGSGPRLIVDDAQWPTLAQQRCRHHGPNRGSACSGAGRRYRELRLRGQDVLDVDRPPIAQNPSAHGVGHNRDGIADRQ